MLANKISNGHIIDNAHILNDGALFAVARYHPDTRLHNLLDIAQR